MEHVDGGLPCKTVLVVGREDAVLLVREKGATQWGLPRGSWLEGEEKEASVKRVAREVACVEGGIVDDLGLQDFAQYPDSAYRGEKWSLYIYQGDRELPEEPQFVAQDRFWATLEDAAKEFQSVPGVNQVMQKLVKHPYFHTPTCDDAGPSCTVA